MYFPLFPLVLLPTVLALPQVKLGNTTVVGTEFPSFQVEFFGGIPFAEPPLGSLRFQPPVLKTSIDGTTFDASEFKFACLQTVLPPDAVSEDCLTINVFRPAGVSANDSLPVMAWIYGGGFVMGASSIYNGTGIVAESIVRGTPILYVNFNYRVGPLGFPQGTEAANHNALNLGLKDQLAALNWIQANIGVFGGDKTKVTVFGESAGATSIDIHYLGPSLSHLARAVIFESSAIAPTFGPEHAESAWETYVSAVPECASVATSQHTISCLQGANSSSLLEAFVATVPFTSTTFSPVIDGPGGLLPDLPSKLTPRARLPAMLGTNLDEGALFTPQDINSTAEIQEFIIAACTPSPSGPEALAAAVNEILVLYPDIPALGSPFNTGNDTFGLSSEYKRFAAIFGDFVFQFHRRSFIQAASKSGLTTFGYLFTDPDATISPGLTVAPPAPGSLGITHSSEISYVYGAPLNPTPTALALSAVMVDYWISFATSLNPNDGLGHPRLEWPQYTPNNQVVIQLNGHNTTVIPDNFRAQQIAFINSDPIVFHR